MAGTEIWKCVKADDIRYEYTLVGKERKAKEMRRSVVFSRFVLQWFVPCDV